MITLNINNHDYNVNVEPDTKLLWVLRDNLNFKGAKFGCGIAKCGACKVLVNGIAMPSCILAIGPLLNSKIVTVEGLAEKDGQLHKVQEAWIEENVPQCGYCQTGQIISAVALLNQNPVPSDEDISNAMSSNICRCGTYDRIKKAIKTLANNNE